jgi:ribosomal-protein-alanine N-acetyltransferase
VEEDAEGVAGYAGLDAGSEVADVMTLAVAPRAQGRGLGRTLLEELVDRARRRGAEYLMLEVRDDNLPARRLYERAGFELLTTRRRYYQPGDVDAHILRLTLDETTSEEETA